MTLGLHFLSKHWRKRKALFPFLVSLSSATGILKEGGVVTLWLPSTADTRKRMGVFANVVCLQVMLWNRKAYLTFGSESSRTWSSWFPWYGFGQFVSVRYAVWCCNDYFSVLSVHTKRKAFFCDSLLSKQLMQTLMQLNLFFFCCMSFCGHRFHILRQLCCPVDY